MEPDSNGKKCWLIARSYRRIGAGGKLSDCGRQVDIEVDEFQRKDHSEQFAAGANGTWSWDFRLDPTSSSSAWRQLYRQIRHAIVSGRLKPGTRIPGTRSLAIRLCCSRATILEAIAQLAHEGYLSRRAGGSRVADVVVGSESVSQQTITEPVATLSRRGEMLSPPIFPETEPYRAFAPSLPDISLFHFPFGTNLRGSGATRALRCSCNQMPEVTGPCASRSVVTCTHRE